ncbi:penicillin-binding protein [Cytobacillus depressus]|uniref:serine-type D-Ala-D-Ala carboxypeptidase n=1 Tax=Cytobacillus depressus TaxID=1602942 RepID=A0A6L3V7K3_9BACI|nr:penicillin-binding protein [Cytobacillus depressus]KAB2337412.1 penicillin-binding protein [Cytobacillus depressus]
MLKKQPNINFGAAILFVIFGLLFFVLVYRFISIQITGEIRGHVLAAEAQQKYEKEKTIEAKRGTIFDRNGEVIATDTNSYKLIAILDEKMTSNKNKPRHVVDPEKTARELAKVIDMKESEIYRILTKINPKTNENYSQVEFGKAGRDISNQKKRKIEELKLPGITFSKDTKRFYPNGVFASHLVGYVEKKEIGQNKTETVGKLGLEQSLNDILTGKNGKVKYESDIWGYLLSNSEEHVTPAANGQDVYLTIDKKIQTFLEDSMNKVASQYKPKKIMAVVADPKTGEILAMGQRPSFHPITKEGINETWHNEVIENSFEPGSTMKIFTLGAAIEEGVFNLNDTFHSGQYAVDKKSRVRDWNEGRGWGTISYLEGVQRSSNVAFAKLVKEKLGYDAYEKYLTKFGFDHPTGIELPNETGGKIVYNWPLEKITTGFGQGTAITPIQQIQAATAIANGGNMMQPHIISKVVDPNKVDEVVKKTKPNVVGKPISANTAKQVRDILGTVVSSPKGTGFNYYNIEGYEVAGKTGTAQIPKPTGGYLTGRQNYVFSFLGMAPKDDPKLIVYVAVQQPEIDIYTSGSVPVAEVFNPVMKSSLQYLNIDPVIQNKAHSETIPNVTSVSTEEAIKQLSEKGMEPVVIGNGSKIIQQLPEDGATLLSGEKVILRTDGDLFIPDMLGWSLRDVMKIAKLGNLQLNSVGNGYVKKQNMKPGTLFSEGEYLIVELELPKEKYKKDDEEESVEEESVEEETIEVRD